MILEKSSKETIKKFDLLFVNKLNMKKIDTYLEQDRFLTKYTDGKSEVKLSIDILYQNIKHFVTINPENLTMLYDSNDINSVENQLKASFESYGNDIKIINDWFYSKLSNNRNNKIDNII